MCLLKKVTQFLISEKGGTLKEEKNKVTKIKRKGKRVKKAEGKGICNGKGLIQKGDKTFFKSN